MPDDLAARISLGAVLPIQSDDRILPVLRRAHRPGCEDGLEQFPGDDHGVRGGGRDGEMNSQLPEENSQLSNSQFPIDETGDDPEVRIRAISRRSFLWAGAAV